MPGPPDRLRLPTLLARHGHLGDPKGDEATALEACTQIALSGGTFLAPSDKPSTFDRDMERPDRRFAANFEHFDVHCAVRIDRDDDEGRERLVRYCTRPVLSLDRLSVLKDGRVSYRVKYPRRGRTHRVMTGPEFLARLAALVAPPRHPLVRYFGILAPGAKDRSRVVPRPPQACKKVCRKVKAENPNEERLPLSLAAAAHCKPTNGRSDRPSLAELASTVRLDASVITVRHWERLAQGALYAASSRVDWVLSDNYISPWTTIASPHP
jgi:hypothetical protein